MDFKKKIIIVFGVYLITVLLSLLFLNTLLDYDTKIFLLISQYGSPILNELFVTITLLGSSFFWLLAILLLWIKGKRKLAIYLLYAFVIDSLLSLFLKFSFNRMRPYEALSNVKALGLEIETGAGFPSGHTERAFSGAFIISSFYKKFRIIMYSLALLVAVSRIYNGLHYPTDILFGALNGIVVGVVVLKLPTEKFQRKLEKIFNRKLFRLFY